MSIDERSFELLIEQSGDEHRDAMQGSRAALVELDELRRESRLSRQDASVIARSSFLRTLAAPGVLATAGLGLALLALSASPAFADQAADVQMLQTAASIENLAVATYGAVLGFPFIGGPSANPVLRSFATKTRAQHQAHAAAFNAVLVKLGGTRQLQPDPVLLAVVSEAKPRLVTPVAVVRLAITLETDAAQTYVAGTGAVADANARKVFASIMGIEAQHAAILLAVEALLAGHAPDLIALPPDASKLPAAAGSVGFPDSFVNTDRARPATEGAVR